nr:RNA-binding cell elongation regulator Jag/EloR [Lysinibacillus timonensis]
MKQLTQLGATVEEALQLALQKLGTTRDQVDVEVLQEGKKGFLGFGAKQAKVRVTLKEQELKAEMTSDIQSTNVLKPIEKSVEPSNLEKEAVKIEPVVTSEALNTIVLNESIVEQKEDPIEKTKEYLTNIAKEMGIHDLSVRTESTSKRLMIKLESEKAALLIGKHGATLNALQQLTQLVINNTAKTFISVTLDVENYRERRQTTLEQLADRMADKAVRTGRKVAFEPMPSYERKIIHNALANRVDIETYSEGTEPNRYLVIEPLR